MKLALNCMVFILVVSFGCKKKEEPPQVQVNNTPVACFETSKSHYRKMETVKLTNCSENFVRVEWYFGDGAGSFFTEPEYKYPGPGVYTIRLKTFLDVNSDEATKKIWVADTIRVDYTMNWEHTVAKLNDLVIVRFYYRKSGETGFRPAFIPGQIESLSHLAGNASFYGHLPSDKRTGFVDVPDPSDAFELKIVAACYTGSATPPNVLVAKDSLVTQVFDGFNGPAEPSPNGVFSVGKYNLQFAMTHR